MSEIKRDNSLPHSFTVSGRSSMDISGVREVISFDESNVMLMTDGGEMSIEGTGLKVSVLDTDSGRVSLSGKVNAVYYFDDAAEPRSHGFFGKLFK